MPSESLHHDRQVGNRDCQWTEECKGTLSLKRIFSGLIGVAAVLTVSACSATPEDQLTELRSAIDAGDECPELFPLLKEIPGDDPAVVEAQAEMRNIGCFSRTSERTDADRSAIDPDSDWIGVPGGQRVEVAAECLNTSEQAAAMSEVDFEAAEQLIYETLEVCQDTNEWLSAVEQYPGVMGMVDGSIPSVTDIEIACAAYPDTTVCTDFAALGTNS